MFPIRLINPGTQNPSVVPRSKQKLPPIRPRALTAPPSPCITPAAADTTHDFYKPNQPSFISPLRSAASSTSIASPQASRILCASAVRCRDLHCARPWFHRCWGITVKGSDLYHGPHDDFLKDEDMERNKRGLLPLQMACRRIYDEAIPILYECTSFSMLHVESVISLADTRLPQRLNAIRSMELGLFFHINYPLQCRVYRSVKCPLREIATWETVWSILASMEGLVSLRVDIVGPSSQPLTSDGERLLSGAAMKVTRPRVWDMRLECEKCRVGLGGTRSAFQAIEKRKNRG